MTECGITSSTKGSNGQILNAMLIVFFDANDFVPERHIVNGELPRAKKNEEKG